MIVLIDSLVISLPHFIGYFTAIALPVISLPGEAGSNCPS